MIKRLPLILVGGLLQAVLNHLEILKLAGLLEW
jgi:predicted transcriptional regulator